MANNILFRTPLTKSIINHVQRRSMPVNVPPTATGKRRFRLAVETDPHKLVNYCCGLNYHIDEPLIKLKADEEYPDWLWNLRLTPKLPSYEMEKGTKEYYLRLAEEGKQRNYEIKMKSSKEKKVVDPVIKFQEDYLDYKKFAALAFLEDDPGLPQDYTSSDIRNSIEPKTHKSDYYLPVNKKRVIYMDKIEGNRGSKNYNRDLESTFNRYDRPVEKRTPLRLKPFQDSRQRHRYSVF